MNILLIIIISQSGNWFDQFMAKFVAKESYKEHFSQQFLDFSPDTRQLILQLECPIDSQQDDHDKFQQLKQQQWRVDDIEKLRC